MSKRLSEEMTAMTDKRNEPCEPGKMWVKVIKTETRFDAKGYMVTEDIETWEQQDVPKK